jgi:hypothetical protein
MEENFDCGCNWPPSVGNPSTARDSHHPGIADFLLQVCRHSLTPVCASMR